MKYGGHDVGDEMDLEFNGTKKSVKEWALKIGLSESTIKRRFKKGWEVERILTTPALSTNQHSANLPKAKVIKREVKPITWKEATFEVTVTMTGKKGKVKGFVKDIWGVYEKPYGRCALIHLPTGKRVGWNTLKIPDLQKLAEILTPLFPAGELPEEKSKVLEITKVVSQYFSERNVD